VDIADGSLAAGAVDFIDKSRRWPILIRRIELIAEAARANSEHPPQKKPQLPSMRLISDFPGHRRGSIERKPRYIPRLPAFARDC
jgi:hypothetical protein